MCSLLGARNRWRELIALAERAWRIRSIRSIVCRSRSALLEGDLFCPDTWGLSASPSVAVCLIKHRCWRARFVGCMELLCVCHGCMGKQAIALHGILICNMDLLSCILSTRAFRWSHILAIWIKKHVSIYMQQDILSNLGHRSKIFYMRARVLWLKP